MYDILISVEIITHSILRLPIDFLKRYFKIKTLFRSNSLFSVGIKRTEDVYLLQNMRNVFGAIHSVFVSVVCCNPMRQYVPNFLYLFGHKRTTPIYINAKGNVTSWALRSLCEPEKNECDLDTKLCSTYKLFYESVDNNVLLSDFCESCNIDEFLQIFMQILYSLREANKLHGFIHGNLHSGAIFIKGLREKMTIKYEDVYLTSDFLARMFSFAQSQIIYKDKLYRGQSKSNKQSSLLHDAYNLLISSLTIMKKSGNTSAFEGLSSLLGFFNTGKLVDFMKTNIRFEDLIKFIGVNMKLNFITREKPSNYGAVSIDGDVGVEFNDDLVGGADTSIGSVQHHVVLDPGTYVVKGLHRRVSGSATVETTRADITIWSHPIATIAIGSLVHGIPVMRDYSVILTAPVNSYGFIKLWVRKRE